MSRRELRSIADVNVVAHVLWIVMPNALLYSIGTAMPGAMQLLQHMLWLLAEIP